MLEGFKNWQYNRVVQKSRISPIFQNALIYLGLNFTLKIPVSEITHPWIRANSKNALISKNWFWFSPLHHLQQFSAWFCWSLSIWCTHLFFEGGWEVKVRKWTIARDRREPKKFDSNEQNWKYDKIRAFFSKLEQKIRAFWDNSWCSNLKLEG